MTLEFAETEFELMTAICIAMSKIAKEAFRSIWETFGLAPQMSNTKQSSVMQIKI